MASSTKRKAWALYFGVAGERVIFAHIIRNQAILHGGVAGDNQLLVAFVKSTSWLKIFNHAKMCMKYKVCVIKIVLIMVAVSCSTEVPKIYV